MMQDQGQKFPFFVDIHGWKVLIVGGGSIAARRVSTLLRFGAEITVVSPQLTDTLRDLTEEGKITWLPGKYHGPVIEQKDWRMVLAVTDDAEENHRITSDAREHRIPANNAADQTDCDFFFPAIIQGSGVTIGVSSDGSDHHRVREVAAGIREEYGE